MNVYRYGFIMLCELYYKNKNCTQTKNTLEITTCIVSLQVRLRTKVTKSDKFYTIVLHLLKCVVMVVILLIHVKKK